MFILILENLNASRVSVSHMPSLAGNPEIYFTRSAGQGKIKKRLQNEKVWQHPLHKSTKIRVRFSVNIKIGVFVHGQLEDSGDSGL